MATMDFVIPTADIEVFKQLAKDFDLDSLHIETDGSVTLEGSPSEIADLVQEALNITDID